MKRCVVTGANGFVGSKIRQFLQRNGWSVSSWVRQPRSESSSDARFVLGELIDENGFIGVEGLVHAAYDFRPRRWEDIVAVNVEGSKKLLAAARKAGVKSIIVISTISAFPGCQSLYGKAKMEIENFAAQLDA